MEIGFSFVSVAGSCLAQACCWYTVFKWCGCIQGEREVIRTEPVLVQAPKPPNPFLNPSLPKDRHLEPAYR
jgi:hypothetical protein